MAEPSPPFDIAIIGAGIAGASIAAEVGGDARVILIEGEPQPGYHSTGRSAAFWSETYGGTAIQPLTTASEARLRDGGFLSPRGEMHLAGPNGAASLAAMEAEFAGSSVALTRLSAEEAARRIPEARPGHGEALTESTCADIDVGGLHAHYLARARRAGVTMLSDARVTGLRRESDGWHIATTAGDVVADKLVNAAGAWASEIAMLAGASPIAITPYRRTIVQLVVDPPVPADYPLLMDAEGGFYFKPEAGGRLWLSPHDETETAPCDAAPEEIDVAIAIDRFERAFDWRIVKRERAWAGLRSFAPDRVPVYGFDTQAPGFFWFAGQGGFGIQTAPAAAMIGAALLLGRPLPDAVAGIDVGRYGPGRFG